MSIWRSIDYAGGRLRCSVAERPMTTINHLFDSVFKPLHTHVLTHGDVPEEDQPAFPTPPVNFQKILPVLISQPCHEPVGHCLVESKLQCPHA